jgi:poly(A) polymerase
MLKIFANLFRRKGSTLDNVLVYPDGKRYYKESHSIRKTQIDPDAIKIIHRLNKFGYKAFLVGGGVRDLLLGKKPKDFDIATNATPNQIKKMFNNCRIIGRRFKIVHILFKGKVIEVSTFRSLPEHRNEKHNKDKDYLMKKDNIYGSAKEDAARRDFTINSLYFDTRNESIIDYVGGFEDIQNRVLRVIGDPDMSFKEDPVRMLRAVKFSVLLGMEIEKKTKLAIKKNRLEILKAAPARMIEEYNKIFRTWKTSLIFKGLADNHLLDAMIPQPFEHIKKDELWIQTFFDSGVGKRLAITDKLLTEREEMTPCIFYALICYDLVKPALESTKGNLAHSIKQSLDPFCESMGISKRDKDKLIKMFTSQPRFLSIEDEKAEQNAFFKKKDFFYDAFMVFKIIAISKQDDVALQSAFFWEISLRQRPVRDFANKNHSHNHNHSPNPNSSPSQNKKPFKQGRGRRPPHNRNTNEGKNSENSNQNGEENNSSTSKED